MNKLRTLFTVPAVLLIHAALNAQDVRTLETRVADLLARLPADNRSLPPPYGGNVRRWEMREHPIFADRWCLPAQVMTRRQGMLFHHSRHTSPADKDNSRKRVWEKQCIRFMKAATDREVRAFFMKQLNLVGSDAAVEALADYAGNTEICDDAVMALQSVGSDEALRLLASALRGGVLPVQRRSWLHLQTTGTAGAVESYIAWYAKGNQAEKAAALYAHGGHR